MQIKIQREVCDLRVVQLAHFRRELELLHKRVLDDEALSARLIPRVEVNSFRGAYDKLRGLAEPLKSVSLQTVASNTLVFTSVSVVRKNTHELVEHFFRKILKPVIVLLLHPW